MKETAELNGVIVVNKPMDYTSFDVIAVMRGLLGQRKIGHCGTLDPNATGVLPLLLGNATKAQDIVPNHDKEYVAGFKLGMTSDTLDIWGKILTENKSQVSKAEAEEALKKFVGEIEQIPPMYSAVQIDGKRLYDLAREGKEVERQSRKVTVYNAGLLSFDDENQSGTIRVKCSKGTYIRTIIDDLGKELGCGAVMNSLQRVSACGYNIEDAVDFLKAREEENREKLLTHVMPVESLFTVYGYVAVSEPQAKRFSNGGELDINRTFLGKKGCEDGEIYRIKTKDGVFLGLGKVNKEKNVIKFYKKFS